MKKMHYLMAMLALACGGLAHAGETELIGGTPADPKDYPSSVYASMNSARCTATVVGPRVLYIAAHCVNNGGTAGFSVGPNQYTSVCTHASGYRRNDTADWSLCKVDRIVTGTKYEDVLTDASLLKVGTKLLLTGYGCVRRGGGGGNDGIYRTGESTIVTLPSGNSNDIVTRNGAALCYGDSGGPAFLVSGSLRWLVSINSRGDIATTSYLSSVTTDEAKAFVSSWSETNDVSICGVHAGTPDCHNGEADDDDGDPSDNCKAQLADYEGSLSLTAGKFQALKACVDRADFFETEL